MRNLCEVIDQMLAVIPKDKYDLIEALKDHKESAELAPPEMILFHWNEVGDTLYSYVFSDFYPEIGWQSKLEKIWTGDED